MELGYAIAGAVGLLLVASLPFTMAWVERILMTDRVRARERHE